MTSIRLLMILMILVVLCSAVGLAAVSPITELQLDTSAAPSHKLQMADIPVAASAANIDRPITLTREQPEALLRVKNVGSEELLIRSVWLADIITEYFKLTVISHYDACNTDHPLSVSHYPARPWSIQPNTTLTVTLTLTMTPSTVINDTMTLVLRSPSRAFFASVHLPSQSQSQSQPSLSVMSVIGHTLSLLPVLVLLGITLFYLLSQIGHVTPHHTLSIIQSLRLPPTIITNIESLHTVMVPWLYGEHVVNAGKSAEPLQLIRMTDTDSALRALLSIVQPPPPVQSQTLSVKPADTSDSNESSCNTFSIDEFALQELDESLTFDLTKLSLRHNKSLSLGTGELMIKTAMARDQRRAYHSNVDTSRRSLSKSLTKTKRVGDELVSNDSDDVSDCEIRLPKTRRTLSVGSSQPTFFRFDRPVKDSDESSSAHSASSDNDNELPSTSGSHRFSTPDNLSPPRSKPMAVSEEENKSGNSAERIFGSSDVTSTSLSPAFVPSLVLQAVKTPTTVVVQPNEPPRIQLTIPTTSPTMSPQPQPSTPSSAVTTSLSLPPLSNSRPLMPQSSPIRYISPRNLSHSQPQHARSLTHSQSLSPSHVNHLHYQNNPSPHYQSQSSSYYLQQQNPSPLRPRQSPRMRPTNEMIAAQERASAMAALQRMQQQQQQSQSIQHPIIVYDNPAPVSVQSVPSSPRGIVTMNGVPVPSPRSLTPRGYQSQSSSTWTDTPPNVPPPHRRQLTPFTAPPQHTATRRFPSLQNTIVESLDESVDTAINPWNSGNDTALSVGSAPDHRLIFSGTPSLESLSSPWPKSMPSSPAHRQSSPLFVPVARPVHVNSVVSEVTNSDLNSMTGADRDEDLLDLAAVQHIRLDQDDRGDNPTPIGTH